MKAKTPYSNSSLTRPGFTLVELLVVITIIIVIAAISLTGMRRLRDYAEKANSLKNISQLHLANTSYASDHSGRYVSLYATDENGSRTGFWYQDPTYLGYLTGESETSSGRPLRAAPSSSLDPKVYRERKSMHHSMAASYGMSESGLMGMSGPNVNAAHYMHRIPNPAMAMAFATATDYRIGYNARFTWTESQPRATSAIAYRHGGKALVVYFDGHAGEMSRADIKDIDSRGGKNNAFWNPRAN